MIELPENLDEAGEYIQDGKNYTWTCLQDGKYFFPNVSKELLTLKKGDIIESEKPIIYHRIPE